MNMLRLISSVANRFNKDFWGVPYTAIGPDGSVQTTEAGTTTPLKTMQIVYNTTGYDSKTGEETYVYDPVITINVNDLNPFPRPGEDWIFHIPASPQPNAPMIPWKMHKTRFIREDAIGTCRIFLQKVKQK